MNAENKILPVTNKIINTGDRSGGFGGGYRPNVSNRKKDRRKTPYDRRKSVRDGVIVTLSFKKDRRKAHDRRLSASVRSVPKDDSKGSIHDIIA
ncbi:hypothetical protein DO021_09940 [Desulfobacter hydrogenophilus]|uniref:Uncharacterized protein n=1 Tax=Desulfobacter hydrogenophilus TaxID=2291 RepID=A0A328FGB9_9BACT|nr:hypothetical protein [Desulfobacter hydrogenophilus]NDY70487.1 hypothetical protein [Desulfobacter hydrogenophilus]QBH13864.1 hypothetical protein EYB58_13590 [Desulfobacter hydrogenophilus]RAM02093.1 hypothetical protein DO021_09940 [Desulfobacter hydrogenophilus]